MKSLNYLFILLAIWVLPLTLSAQSISIAHGPYLQNLDEREVTIMWLSNKPSIGWVELAPDDSTSFYLCERPKFFDSVNGVKNISEIHSVKIKNLTPGTSYRYRIFSQEILKYEGTDVVYGKVASTNVFRKAPLKFTTNDRNKVTTSFIMVNDIHGRARDISKLLKASNYKTKDMVFFNGDMLSKVPNRDTIFSGFMDESIHLFAAEKPMYYARGNHETRGIFAVSFQELFSAKVPNLYYMFRQGPVCFIVLDTGEDKPDSDIEYSGITDYDNYRSEQAEWLAKAVLSEEFKTASYKVVIAHMPPLTQQKDMWHGAREVMCKFVPILNNAGIDVMLCGHLHKVLYQPASENIKFPVWVNSFNTVMEGEVKNGKLQIKLLDINGQTLDEHQFPDK